MMLCDLVDELGLRFEYMLICVKENQGDLRLSSSSLWKLRSIIWSYMLRWSRLETIKSRLLTVSAEAMKIMDGLVIRLI